MTRWISEPFALRHGLVTFLAFVAAGSIPLLPFIFQLQAHQFGIAVALTAVVLFAVGAARGLITHERWWVSGLEMLFIGATAAGVAYGIARIVARLIGVAVV